MPDSLRDGLAGQVLELLPDDVGVTLLSPERRPGLRRGRPAEVGWWWFGIVALAALAGALGVLPAPAGHAAGLGGDHRGVRLPRPDHPPGGPGPLHPAARPENREAVGAMYDSSPAACGSGRCGWSARAAGPRAHARLGPARAGRRRSGARPAGAPAAGGPRGAAAARPGGRRRSRAGDRRGIGVDLPAEPWPRRVAVGTRAFVDGLDLPDPHRPPGRDRARPLRPRAVDGIAIGAWCSCCGRTPTLSVLIWIVALVAAVLLGARVAANQAPEPVPAATAAGRRAGCRRRGRTAPLPRRPSRSPGQGPRARGERRPCRHRRAGGAQPDRLSGPRASDSPCRRRSPPRRSRRSTTGWTCWCGSVPPEMPASSPRTSSAGRRAGCSACDRRSGCWPVQPRSAGACPPAGGLGRGRLDGGRGTPGGPARSARDRPPSGR